MNPPPVLKPLVRILKTAQQIEKHAPLVAWCCRHYAAELGMELRQGSNDPAILKYLSDILDLVEESKAEADSIATNKAEYMRDFSDKVFGVAETEYQSGTATKNTARSFLHASVFYETLKQFSPLTEEITGRIRYSKWKATEIMNALAEGRQPMPDGLSEKQLSDEMSGIESQAPVDVPDTPSFGQMSYAANPPSVTSPQLAQRGIQSPPQMPFQQQSPATNLSDSGDLDLPDVPVFSSNQLHGQRSAPFQQQQPPVQQQSQQQPFSNSSAPSFSSAPSSNISSPNLTQQNQQQHTPQQQPMRPVHEVPRGNSSAFTQFLTSRVISPPKPAQNANIDIILEATKFSKNAISALQFDDPESAIKNLRGALRILTGDDH